MEVVRGSPKEEPKWTHQVSWLLRPQTFSHLIAARPPLWSLFFSFSQSGHSGITHSWSGKSHRKQYRNKNRASTGEEGTTLSFRIWQPPFKLYQTPAFPSLCRNVSFNIEEFYCPTFPLSWWHFGGGAKTSGDPMGHLQDSPPRCTLWPWHNFPVRRHKSLCFCVSGQSVKREKKTIQIPPLKRSACTLLFCERGSALLGWRR